MTLVGNRTFLSDPGNSQTTVKHSSRQARPLDQDVKIFQFESTRLYQIKKDARLKLKIDIYMKIDESLNILLWFRAIATNI